MMTTEATHKSRMVLRAVIFLFLALAVSVPAYLSPISMTAANAFGEETDGATGGGGTIGGGGGATEGPPPRTDYKPDNPAPGNPNKGGGTTTTGPLISDIHGEGANSTATYVTKKYVSGVVDLRTGRNDAKSDHWVIKQHAVLACGLDPLLNGTTTQNVGARVGISVTITETYQYSGGKKGKRLNSSTSYGKANVSCLTLNFSYRDLRCFVDAKGNIKQVTPNSRTITTATGSTPYGRGNKSYDGCMMSQSIYLSVNTQLSDYGRYQAQANHRYQNIRVRVPTSPDPITGKWPAKTVVSRSGVVNSTTNYSYAQLTCKGVNIGKSKGSVWTGSWNWSHSDCPPDSGGGGGVYQCSGIADNAVINGQSTNSATVFRDGEDNSLSFPRVTLNGKGAKVHSTKTQVLRSGTPWDTNGSRSAKSNDFQLKANGKGSSVFSSNKGTPWMNGNVNSYAFSSTWSSNKGSPTVLRPRYEFDVTINTPSVKITEWNLTTGDIHYNRTTSPVRGKAVCEGKSVSIDVVRSKESG